MKINEKSMLKRLKDVEKAVLLEPAYDRKYMPLGLAKISSYIKEHGGETVFQRKYRPCGEDLVCVATLFTYESQEVFKTLREIYSSSYFTNKIPDVLVGGVFASLMPEEITSRFPEADVFVGYSKELDKTRPDYSIDWKVNNPWEDYSFVFTTRGCPNKCDYCAVPTLEPDLWINERWKETVDLSRPNIMISDNNLASFPREHFKEIINFLLDNDKKVVFDNGFDCKYITQELAEDLAKLDFVRNGIRLSFDRIEEKDIFPRAVKTLISSGVKKADIMLFVLFNYRDTPREAYFRAKTCIDLGVRVYPQVYEPLDELSRDNRYIGEHWTKNLVRAFRYFHLMMGLYIKYDFMEWVQQESVVRKFNLTEEAFRKMEVEEKYPVKQRSVEEIFK